MRRTEGESSETITAKEKPRGNGQHVRSYSRENRMFFHISGVTQLFYYHCNGNLLDTIRPVYKSNICFTRESCTKALFFQLFFFF